MSHFSALLTDSEWAKKSASERLNVLRQAIDQVWESLIVTGQQLKGRVDVVEQRVPADLGRLSQRIKAVEDRLDAKDAH